MVSKKIGAFALSSVVTLSTIGNVQVVNGQDIKTDKQTKIVSKVVEKKSTTVAVKKGNQQTQPKEVVKRDNKKTPSKVVEEKIYTEISKEITPGAVELLAKVKKLQGRIDKELKSGGGSKPVNSKKLKSVSRGNWSGYSGYSDYDLRISSGLNGGQIDKALEGTELHGIGEACVKAEKMYGVNALALASIAVLESGWGTSTLAKERNNLVGFGAYDYNVDAARYFNSREECMLEVAKLLKNSYLNPKGKYYKGVTLRAVNIYYCSSPEWHTKVSSIMYKLLTKLR